MKINMEKLFDFYNFYFLKSSEMENYEKAWLEDHVDSSQKEVNLYNKVVKNLVKAKKKEDFDKIFEIYEFEVVPEDIKNSFEKINLIQKYFELENGDVVIISKNMNGLSISLTIKDEKRREAKFGKPKKPSILNRMVKIAKNLKGK